MLKLDNNMAALAKDVLFKTQVCQTPPDSRVCVY